MNLKKIMPAWGGGGGACTREFPMSLWLIVSSLVVILETNP